MPTDVPTSDQQILEYLREFPEATVADLAAQTGVTATAVRQRLQRLLASGLIERSVFREGRGRPLHKYALTEKGQRATGNNYADLATVLWNEIRAVREPAVRRQLLSRIARALAADYGQQIQGDTLAEKMQSLARLMGEREIPFTVREEEGLPVLTALACPYPELAEQDRSICAMEKMMLAEALGENVRLGSCRLDGAHCCTFEATAG